ncbi:hypothetical protein MCOR25_006344, partial [Pyricularia grisea]
LVQADAAVRLTLKMNFCLITCLVGRHHFSPLGPEAGLDEGQQLGDGSAVTISKIDRCLEIERQKDAGW